jgi:endonuclease/exonuclease/phosphatase family metal-dependent hydrolase
MSQLPRGRYSIGLTVVSYVLAMTTIPTSRADEIELKVVTYNVLVELSAPAGIPSWSKRRDAIVELLRQEQADLIAIQEPTPRQLDYLVDKLKDYAVIRDEKFTDAALLFRRDIFEKLDEGKWWLSPTPEKPMSRGFGNFLPRILVWAKLKHTPSGGELFASSTHFDNTTPSQMKMAALCQKKWEPFLQQKIPIIWMGDFNTDQERGDYPMLTSNGFSDAYIASPDASQDGKDDNVSTFPGDHGKRIDHILVHGSIRATQWRVITYQGTILSDHYPVAAKLMVTFNKN